jgi:hypothetical protein
MSLSLITDRTAEDVAHAIALLSKRYEDMTAAEQDEYDNTSLKGCYSDTDYNRVGAAVSYLAGLLNGYGYAVTITGRSDWPEGYEPNATERAAYLADLQALKDVFYGTEDLPAACEYFTVDIANAAERLLMEIDANINSMVANFQRCGSAVCGGDYL